MSWVRLQLQCSGQSEETHSVDKKTFRLNFHLKTEADAINKELFKFLTFIIILTWIFMWRV